MSGGDIPFPLLSAPLELGRHKLRNRFVHAPMSVGYGEADGRISAALIGHYKRRAAGGAAMVMTENFAISESGRQMPRQPMIGEDRLLGGLHDLAAAIKSEGALAIAQLVHSGRYAGPWDEYGARRRLAPSAIKFELRPGEAVVPQEISKAEIEHTVEEFTVATAQAREAGFDGVELHGAQGFLISSFLSPRMNFREDEYGLDRSLFAREVVAAVRGAAGPEMLLGFHLMSDEMMPGGWQPADAVQLAAILGELGIDFFIPVATTFESLRVVGPERGLRFDRSFARRIGAATDAAIFANGGLGDPEEAEAALTETGAVAVALARPTFSDPDLPTKVLAGRAAERRVCTCAPPTCILTQLTGSICDSWPKSIREAGSWGMEPAWPEPHVPA